VWQHLPPVRIEPRFRGPVGCLFFLGPLNALIARMDSYSFPYMPLFFPINLPTSSTVNGPGPHGRSE
jgi:hypothetical protein